MPDSIRLMAMSTLLNHVPPMALCAVVALCGGLIGGASAVHGLRTNSYGPLDPPALITHGDEPGYAPASSDQETSVRCDDCSERDLGYRWAVLQAVRSSAECPNDSWSFRRGCLDYTGGV